MFRNFILTIALSASVFTTACATSSGANDVADVNASVQRVIAAMSAKDINGIMAYYVPDDSLFVYDLVPPRQYVGAAAYRKDWEGVLSLYPKTLTASVQDWKAETEGNMAYGHGIFRTVGPDKDGNPLDLTVRVTDVFKKINGKWLVVHEHVSVPVDLATGKPDLSSKP